MKILILLLFASGLNAQSILKVCATDATCDYTGTASDGQAVRDAVAAAACGDVVELRAGDLWPDSYIGLPDKGCSKFTYLVSSRWYERPIGRLSPTRDQPLLATLRQYNVNEPVIDGFENYYAQDRIRIDSINTSTETITFTAAHGRSDGDRVACRGDNLGQPGGSGLPAGIGEATTYYVVASTSTTYRLASTPGGTPINLTGSPTAVSYCSQVKPTHHWWISGIEIAPDPGTAPPNDLVRFSHTFYSPEALPHHIVFDWVYVHGWQNDNGPKNCFNLNSVRYFTLRNSYISGCKFQGDESHSVFPGTVSYEVRIENNYMEGASMCILTGGTGLLFEGRVEHLEIVGNHCNTPGYMTRIIAAGAPSAAGHWDPYTQTGTRYINSTGSPSNCSGGACYEYRINTWVQDTGLPFFTAMYANKARIEIKQGWHIRVEDNLITYGWGNGDTGNPGTCVLNSGVEPYVTASIKYVSVKNNKCVRTSRFIVAALDNPAVYPVSFGPFVIENNLGTEQAMHPEMSQHSSNSAFYVTSFLGASGTDGLSFKHNTLTSNGSTGNRWFQMDHGASYDATNFNLSDNILPTGSVILNGSAGADCTALATHFPNTPKRVKNIVLTGTGGANTLTSTCTENVAEETTISLESDYSITAASKYSKTCASGCGFQATDGKEVGIDAPALHEAISGSEAGNGKWFSRVWSVSVGSDNALISYDAPTTAACNLKLYTDAARTTLHSDTSDAGEQADDRAGNYSNGVHRIFVLNSLTEATFYPLLTCGTQVKPFEFTTKPSAAVSKTIPRGFSSTRAGRSCSDAAMTTDCVDYSGVQHNIVVPAGGVIFAWEGSASNPLTAYVAP